MAENRPSPHPSSRAALSDTERALLERPSLSIRKRLAFGFFSLFLLCAAVTAAAWIMLSRLDLRLRFLETADRYTMEIQQARRFEKNYFLYGANLLDVQEHLENARRLLESSELDTSTMVPEADLQRMRAHLDRYEALIGQLARLERERPADIEEQRRVAEAEIRSHGAEMVTFALDLAQKERARVGSTLALFKRLPLAFLILLLVLVLLIVNFLGRQMLAPLSRLMGTTERISRGDFTPLKPARWYRDEFSNLALALNTMMRELEHRQEILVQSHKLRAVGTLTAGVAHELNNPINNITLTAEMLKEDFKTLSDAERLEMVEDLVSQAERAQTIVRHLLDFVREGENEAEKLDTVQLLQDSVALTANQVRLSGAKISLETAPNLPPVRGDRQALLQVFTNLVLNALDAMDKGGEVRLSGSVNRERSFVTVRVADDGSGIEPHVLPYIFDPFFTTKPRGKGTGLGLSVSAGIVRQHGGDIQVESRQGQGSTFTVHLPAVMVPTVGGEGHAVAESSPGPPGEPGASR